MQLLDWPHDTNLMRYEHNSVVTGEIEVHALRSFASQFAQGIIYLMKSLGTEDDTDSGDNTSIEDIGLSPFWQKKVSPVRQFILSDD